MRFIIACILIITIVSCQKELSWDAGVGAGTATGTGTGTGSGSSGLLVKTVNISIVDTATSIFSYDANKKLISQLVTVAGPLSEGDFRRHITRDNNGRISFVIDSSLQPGGAWEMDTAHIFYNGTTNTVLYTLSVNYNGSGSGSKDSLVYTYTGANITLARRYQFSGGSYSAEDDYVYVYDASGNITNYKWYALTSSTPLQTEIKNTYDSRSSPFNWGNEVIVLNSIDGAIELPESAFGPNNPVLSEETDHAGGGTTDASTMSYTYLSDNKPSNGTSSYKPAGSPIGIPGTMIFFYQ